MPNATNSEQTIAPNLTVVKEHSSSTLQKENMNQHSLAHFY